MGNPGRPKRRQHTWMTEPHNAGRPDGTELSSDSEELNDVEGFLVTEPATFAFLGLK
jgi:hypothetical protein